MGFCWVLLEAKENCKRQIARSSVLVHRFCSLSSWTGAPGSGTLIHRLQLFDTRSAEDNYKSILPPVRHDFRFTASLFITVAMVLLPNLLLLLSSLVALATSATTETWKSRSIYFVLTDRIARSSSDTGGASCSNLKQYCGGTFKGLQSKLDYIRGMGFDAIWITPVIASRFTATAICL